MYMHALPSGKNSANSQMYKDNCGEMSEKTTWGRAYKSRQHNPKPEEQVLRMYNGMC